MSKPSQAKQGQTEKTTNIEKVIIEFTGPYQRYTNGDVAGFDTEIAEKILTLKPSVAKTYQDNASDPSEETPQG